jgi:hypothetical protein
MPSFKIVSKEEHGVALKRLKDLWSAEPGTSEHDELEELAEVISEWEREEMEGE